MRGDDAAARNPAPILAAFLACLLVATLVVRLGAASAQGGPPGCEPELELCLLDGPVWLAPEAIRYEGPAVATGFAASAEQGRRKRRLERVEVIGQGATTKTWRVVLPAGLSPGPTTLRAMTDSPELRRATDGHVRQLASKPRVSIERSAEDRVAEARVETRGPLRIKLEMVLKARYPAEDYERVASWKTKKQLIGAGSKRLRLHAENVVKRCEKFAACKLKARVATSSLGYALGRDAARDRISTPPERPTGRLGFVPSHTERTGSGRGYSYAIYVERGVKIDKQGFGRAVGRTLADRRGWTRTGRVSFRGVSRSGSANTRIILASPPLVDRLCAPLPTNGYTSCTQGSSVIINLDRWRYAVPHFNSRLEYRRMVTNHEIGHRIGQGHRYCPGSGRKAPVMQQQTLGLQGCRANPWPLSSEARSARAAVSPGSSARE